MNRGIDVSHHNGEINWEKVKKAGIRFAMLRASFGWDNASQIDRQLQANIEGCEAAALPYGLYHYSYAGNEEEAKREAAFFLQAIQGTKPLYPVAFDFEEKNQLALSPEKQLSIIEAFLDKMEKAGYYGALYMSASPLEQLRRTAPKRLDRFDRWVAHVGVSRPAFSGSYGIWQCSWKGKIEGISGNVDLNEAYKDYPAIIRAAGLNGWAKQRPSAEKTVSKAQYDALCTERDALQKRYELLLQKVRGLSQKLQALNEQAKQISA
jgi:GH25 family lysozyme M1 (1,4-beta-N-acetylmuramidase)